MILCWLVHLERSLFKACCLESTFRLPPITAPALLCLCCCKCSRVISQLTHNPLLTKWILRAKSSPAEPVVSGLCLSLHRKGRIYLIPKKTKTSGSVGCALWTVSLFPADGTFYLMDPNTKLKPLPSYSAAGTKIWMLFTALLRCHLGFVHPCWPKYAFSPVWPTPRSYRTLDQRIMHRLSLGLPEQLARAL